MKLLHNFLQAYQITSYSVVSKCLFNMFGTNYYSELGKDKAKAHGTTEQASSGGAQDRQLIQ